MLYPMGRIVISCYRPKPGLEADLLACVRDHLDVLRGEDLVTDRAPIVGRAADGTVVEVFEWASAEAIARAHENPAVLALWERFGACAEFVPLATLPEAAAPFAELEPLTTR